MSDPNYSTWGVPPPPPRVIPPPPGPPPIGLRDIHAELVKQTALLRTLANVAGFYVLLTIISAGFWLYVILDYQSK